MSADLQALIDRVVDAALAAEEQDEHDALRLELLAHDLFRAATRRGEGRFPWAVVPLTASSGDTAWVALTERARLPLPVVIVEGVFADETEAIAAAKEA